MIVKAEIDFSRLNIPYNAEIEAQLDKHNQPYIISDKGKSITIPFSGIATSLTVITLMQTVDHIEIY